MERQLQSGLAGLLLVLLIGALGLAGYFGFQYYQLKLKQQATDVQVLPSPLSEVEEEVDELVDQVKPEDETADWLKFESQTHHFSIKHPKDVSVEETTDNYIRVFLWGPSQKPETEFYDGISLLFQFNPLAGQSLEDVVDASIEEAKEFGQILEAKAPITLNNYQGFTYTAEGLGVFKNIFLEWPGQGYMEIVDSTSDPTSQGYEEIVDQILATLSFF